jgi:iron complex outermembrane receptor protein
LYEEIQMTVFKKTFFPALISIPLSTSLVMAEDADTYSIERVTVQGTLSNTPLKQMASSISVLGELDIEQRQAQHLQDILNRAANVNFASGASRGRFIQIRGIGERSQFVDPISPSVGFLVDGINYSGMVAGASTFDISQIEIFKGPNSTRFGANGLAGMINMLSKDPQSDTNVDAKFGVANYNSWDLGAAVGGALSESANYRLSLHQTKSDGFINNIWLDREDTNNIDELSGRAKLDWQLSSELSLKAVGHLIDVDNGYDAFSLDLNRDTLSDEPGFDRQKSKALGLTADYQGLDWANLQVRYTWLDADLGYGYDEDWSFVGIAPDWEYSATDHYFRNRKDNSVEAKLRANNSGIANWVVGVYYAGQNEDLVRDFFDYGLWQEGVFDSQVERKDLAIFGQYKSTLSDISWLTSSLRLASQQLNYVDSNQIASDTDETDWGAELSYHLQASEQTMLYLSLVRSYKMGGVNGEALGKINTPEFAQFRQLLLDNTTFSPESLLGTEFGIKGGNQDGSLQLDFSLFYQWRDDIQYKNWITQDQSFVGFYNNAADGHNYGLEFAMNYQFSAQLHAFVSAGWLETEINGITRQYEEGVINGREQAHAPKYQANAGLKWQLNDIFSWLIEVDGKDDFFYSYSHDERSDKALLVHSSLDFQLGNWQLSAYVRNLFDRQYANRGFYFGNDPRDEYAAHTYEQYGEPRRIGLSMKYHY